MRNLKQYKPTKEDDIQFLKELQYELKNQETDWQASPRFWSIRDYKYVVSEQGYHDRVILYSPSACEYYTIDDYIKTVLEGYMGDIFTEEQLKELIRICEGLWCEFDEHDVLKWANDNEYDDYELVYEIEVDYIVPNTLFLTKSEAKKHLESNSHHYSDKAHTYAMTAWRAPTVSRLLDILENFDWDEIR